MKKELRQEVVIEEAATKGKDVMRSIMIEGTMLEKVCKNEIAKNDSSRKIVGTRLARIGGIHTCCKE